MMISIIIFAAVILKIQLTVGQIAGSTKCSSLTSCAYSQIRCPPNYYFNGQYCIPQAAAAATPTHPTQPTASPPETKCSPRPPITVSPTNPDPLPVKPVCERFYEWNGRECYQVLSNEPICPIGHNLTADGQCVSVLQAVCQENYYQNGDFCVGLLEAPVVCPNNLYWDGATCVYRIIPTCPEGFVLNNGYCEIFDAGSCPSGTFMDNFKCIGHHQVEIQCDYGYSWNGDNCVNSTNSCDEGYNLRNEVCEKYIIKSADFECPPRTQMNGDQCISIEMICPKGFTLIDSVCVEQITSTNNSTSVITPNCTAGYRLVGCECVKINETVVIPPTPICPPNYSYKDGLCYFEQGHHPPICPINYEIRNGVCVPLRPDTTEKCPPGQKLVDGVCVVELLPIIPTNCSDGHILIQGVCVPLPKCPHIDCQVNYTSSCNCPNGYILNNGFCILTGQVSKVCPPGYEIIDGNCVASENPHVNPCPTGYQWNNGTCVLIYTDTDCTPGYHWIEGNCVPLEPEIPDFKPCPAGFQWTNGSCVNIENPGYKVCPQGYYWINGTCLNSTSVIPNQPDRPNDNGIITHPIIQPCYPNNQNPPCQPCPSNNPPCPSNNQPCQSNNPPCQPCPTYNGSNQLYPPSQPPQGCTDCPQVTHYITKDGHISITNIVNVAHHHQRPSQQHEIPASEDIDNSFDYENGQNTTDDGEATKKCCEVITPRQCKRNGDEWTCFHKKYQRCGDMCTQPKIYLKPKTIHYQPPILIMPPPPRRIYGRRRMFSGGAVGKTKLFYMIPYRKYCSSFHRCKHRKTLFLQHLICNSRRPRSPNVSFH